jgi:antitoxin component YwqK of YwqJK toxin-antitoxin module
MKHIVKTSIIFGAFFAMLLTVTIAPASDDCSGYFREVTHWAKQKQDNDGKCEMANTPDNSEYPADSIPYKLRNGKELCLKHRDELDWEYLWKNGKRISGTRFWGSEIRMTLKFKDSFVPIGPALIWKNDKLFCEVPIDTDGNPDGIVREYDSEGKLINGQRMVKGKQQGGFVHFDKHGEIKSFACEDKPLFDGDAKRCGFSGKPAVVKLAKGTFVTHVNGKLTVEETVAADKSKTVKKFSYSYAGKVTVQTLEYHKNGALFRSFTAKDKKREGKFLEYTDTGKLLHEREYQEGSCVSDKTYYLNGKLKVESTQNPDGKHASAKEYWDNGQLKSVGTLANTNRGYYGSSTVPVGKSYEYSETGALIEEANYDNQGNLDGDRIQIDEKGKRTESVYRKGTLSAKKIFSADGKLELKEEYYEDGSRK